MIRRLFAQFSQHPRHYCACLLLGTGASNGKGQGQGQHCVAPQDAGPNLGTGLHDLHGDLRLRQSEAIVW